MPRSVSPPVSPKTVRLPKRSRQLSKGELSIEELSQDDVGYDADVEVLRPDQYEEPDSDLEQDTKPIKCIATIDEEITRGMRHLGWRQSLPAALTMPITEHFSDLESSPINQYGKRTEFHASPLRRSEGRSSFASPAKRRKKRDSNINMAQPLMKSNAQACTDSSDRTEEKRTPSAESFTGSTAASEIIQPVSDDEMQLD